MEVNMFLCQELAYLCSKLHCIRFAKDPHIYINLKTCRFVRLTC
jgi:hypothetical protein